MERKTSPLCGMKEDKCVTLIAPNYLIIRKGGVLLEKISLLFILVVLVLAFVGGCSSEKVGKVDVYKMESFSVIKEDSLTTYTDSEVVDNFIKAFKKTKKVSGVADVNDPEYKVEFEGDSYYLWLGEEKGSVMNVDDTHTLYALSKRATKTIDEILN